MRIDNYMFSNNSTLHRILLIFYKAVMPGITILLLIVVSSIINRPDFLDSKYIDIFIRILLCLWFCLGYIRLPDIKKFYRIYPNIEWKKVDISLSGKIFYLLIAILFGIATTFLTLWMVNVFLPILSQIGFIIAIINGSIYAIPLIMQYEVFKV
jgi:hypothetical protein